LIVRQRAVLRSLAVSRGDIGNSNPPVNLFFENMSHSILERLNRRQIEALVDEEIAAGRGDLALSEHAR
jgi:hypothetical protein